MEEQPALARHSHLEGDAQRNLGGNGYVFDLVLEFAVLEAVPPETRGCSLEWAALSDCNRSDSSNSQLPANPKGLAFEGLKPTPLKRKNSD